MTYSLEFKWVRLNMKRGKGNASRHQWIENPLHQSPQMTLCLEVTSQWWPPNGVQGQDVGTGGGRICDVLEWWHVWMPQSWKQGQVRLILKKDRQQTVGDLGNHSKYSQSHSTFWMPRAVSKPGRTRKHQEIDGDGKNTSALIHMRLFLTRGMGARTDIDKCWWPPHDTHFHTIHQSIPPSFTLFQPSLNMPWHEAIAR